MANVVTTTVSAAIHKKPSHSRESQRSHSKALDKERLPLSEAIMTERHVTAQAGNSVPPRSLAIPSFGSRRWKLVVDGVPNQSGSKGQEGVTFSSPDFSLDYFGCIGVYLQVARRFKRSSQVR